MQLASRSRLLVGAALRRPAAPAWRAAAWRPAAARLAAPRLARGLASEAGVPGGETVAAGEGLAAPAPVAGETELTARQKIVLESETLYKEEIHGKAFDPFKALEMLRKVQVPRGFDETFEVSVELKLDPRKADQVIRERIALPRPHGKKRIGVYVFCEPEVVKPAIEAGAWSAGLGDLIQKIRERKIKLKKEDMVLAQPSVLRKVQKEISKILGPKGVMPNVKQGTVVEDVVSVIPSFKERVVLMRTGKYPIVNCGIGKMSHSDEHLLDNFRNLMIALVNHKPEGAKGSYMKAVHFKTSMSRSVPVDLKHADPNSMVFMKSKDLLSKGGELL